MAGGLGLLVVEMASPHAQWTEKKDSPAERPSLPLPPRAVPSVIDTKSTTQPTPTRV